MPKLKQLDGIEISVQEKINAGIDVLEEGSDGSEDEDENDDEEEKDEDESNIGSPVAQPIPVNSEFSTYNQLPKIQGNVLEIKDKNF